MPFTVAVLLISLGSDYNVYLAGRVWQHAAQEPLRDALPAAAARATRAITLAGCILAGSFAMLALVPIQAFRELALIMTVGLLVDTLIVRTTLVPSIMMIVGERSAWPWTQRRWRAHRGEPLTWPGSNPQIRPPLENELPG